MTLLTGLMIAVAGLIVWGIWQQQKRMFYFRELAAAKILQNSEEKFRKAFETSPDALAITRFTDGRVVAVNNGFFNVMGYAPEEIAGKLVKDYNIWAKEDERARMRETLQKESVVSNMEMSFRRKNGDIGYGLMSVSTIELEGELHVLGIIRDITKRKLEEQAMQENERKLREAQKMAHLGFWSWDVKTGKVEWSDEVFKIFGLDPVKFTPHIDSILDLSPWSDDHQRGKQLIAAAAENHAPGFYEQRFVRPDQSTGYYYSTFQGIYDEKGGLVTIIGTMLDITERKLAEENIRKLNEELEKKVAERTAALKEAIDNLEKLNRVFVGRELRMAELKKRIAGLEQTGGGPHHQENRRTPTDRTANIYLPYPVINRASGPASLRRGIKPLRSSLQYAKQIAN